MVKRPLRDKRILGPFLKAYSDSENFAPPDYNASSIIINNFSEAAEVLWWMTVTEFEKVEDFLDSEYEGYSFRADKLGNVGVKEYSFTAYETKNQWKRTKIKQGEETSINIEIPMEALDSRVIKVHTHPSGSTKFSVADYEAFITGKPPLVSDRGKLHVDGTVTLGRVENILRYRGLELNDKAYNLTSEEVIELKDEVSSIRMSSDVGDISAAEARNRIESKIMPLTDTSVEEYPLRRV